MQLYDPATEFADPDLEGQLLAALAAEPERYWEIADLLPPVAFTTEESQSLYGRLAESADGKVRPPRVEGIPCGDVMATAATLVGLYQRRQLAVLNQRIAQALYRDQLPPAELIARFEQGLSEIQREHRALQSGVLIFASELLPELEREVARWRQAYQENIAAGLGGITGIPTGFSHLDNLLNGLSARYYVLAAMPGAGKTTLANQIAYQVARHLPVVYVTYADNTRIGLVLKQVCRLAGVATADAEKGKVEVERLRPGIRTFLAEAASRLAYIEGDSSTTVAKIKAKALQAMNRHGAKRCLVVVDYLQKVVTGDGGRDSIREKVNRVSQQLTEIAHTLDSPVLAISAQSRAGYAGGKQAAFLDSLKESGDLEYDADAVLVLREPENASWTPAPGSKPRELVVAKNRYGMAGPVAMNWAPATGAFVEVERNGHR